MLRGVCVRAINECHFLAVLVIIIQGLITGSTVWASSNRFPFDVTWFMLELPTSIKPHPQLLPLFGLGASKRFVYTSIFPSSF